PLRSKLTSPFLPESRVADNLVVPTSPYSFGKPFTPNPDISSWVESKSSGALKPDLRTSLVITTLYRPGGMPGFFPTPAIRYFPLLSVSVENCSRTPSTSVVFTNVTFAPSTGLPLWVTVPDTCAKSPGPFPEHPARVTSVATATARATQLREFMG